jgi:pimeloyl-ACP methyl ester carboxylesterase
MGAKAAMCVALDAPSTVKNLIPVDNAPVDASFKSDFGQYLQGMRAVAKARPKRQSEADEVLKPYAKVFWPGWALCVLCL